MLLCYGLKFWDWTGTTNRKCNVAQICYSGNMSSNVSVLVILYLCDVILGCTVFETEHENPLCDASLFKMSTITSEFCAANCRELWWISSKLALQLFFSSNRAIYFSGRALYLRCPEIFKHLTSSNIIKQPAIIRINNGEGERKVMIYLLLKFLGSFARVNETWNSRKVAWNF